MMYHLILRADMYQEYYDIISDTFKDTHDLKKVRPEEYFTVENLMHLYLMTKNEVIDILITSRTLHAVVVDGATYIHPKGVTSNISSKQIVPKQESNLKPFLTDKRYH